MPMQTQEQTTLNVKLVHFTPPRGCLDPREPDAASSDVGLDSMLTLRWDPKK
jgi:hypothetical protein